MLPIFIWTACSKKISVASHGLAAGTNSVALPPPLPKKLSPHDTYGKHLKDAGFGNTAMGSTWLKNGDESIGKALKVTLPYQEEGYFAAEKVQATALQFNASRGEEIHINISKKPEINFKIYIDLFRQMANSSPALIASADTSGAKIDFEVDSTGVYILRLQPELLSSGEYTLTIASAPSLSFPVSPSGKPHIGSYWSDPRDGGGRKHEGIDILAPRGTPAIAAANGTVTRVSENKLGGLSVYLRPDGKNYTLYYTHLDLQLAHNGQKVMVGDTLGLVGNTGNAAGGPTHLHFGIYTDNGAVDPFPFVNIRSKDPKAITAPAELLNTTARTIKECNLHASPDKKTSVIAILPLHTIIAVNAATGDWYKVTLPDGQPGFLACNMVAKPNNLHMLTLKTKRPLFAAPDSTIAAHKTLLSAGNRVSVLGVYKNYSLVDNKGETGWINN